MSNSEARILPENLKIVLANFIKEKELDVEDVANAIGCPAPVISRVLRGTTYPSEDLLKRCHTMMEIGYKRYVKLSEAEKEKISEALGTVGSAGLGVGASIAIISSLGIPGLSGAGIMSGLAALGSIIGGGAVVGIGIAAAIPLAAAGVGYLLINNIKSTIYKKQLKVEAHNPRWERPLDKAVC